VVTVSNGFAARLGLWRTPTRHLAAYSPSLPLAEERPRLTSPPRTAGEISPGFSVRSAKSNRRPQRKRLGRFCCRRYQLHQIARSASSRPRAKRFARSKSEACNTFNIYGPRMHLSDGRVVQALNGAPITIYGDGTQTRAFYYVDDLIDGFLR
jgi:hypothetical protein